MKIRNIFLILISLIFSLLIVSCNNYQNNDQNNNVIIPTKKITISFDTSGGSEIESIIQSVGKFYELPVPEKIGYTFVGWHHNEAPVITTGEWHIEQDVKLVAKWRPVQYSINYITIGGENTNPATYTIEDELTLEPLKWVTSETDTVTYVFDGWYKDLEYKEHFEAIKKGTTGNIDVYAKWNVINIPEINTETIVTFKADGYDCDGKIFNLTVGDNYSLPIIQKNGYIFAGWQSEDGLINPQNSGVWVFQNEEITLVPKWTKRIYYITYALNGGINNKNNVEVFSITDEIVLYDPTKHNHKFEGWYTDEACENSIDKISQGTFEDITLYAKWRRTAYQITYDLNGGKASTGIYPESYSINTDEFQIGIPFKEGFKFIGWECDDTINYYYKINSQTNKDVNLRALWYKSNYTYQDDNGIQYYLKDDNTLSVVGYVGRAGNILIPYSYNGYSVTEIGDYALCGYGEALSEISTSSFYRFDIPDTVKRIGIGAFEACDDLKVQLSYQSEISFEEWINTLVIEERNNHVLDVITGKRPAIGWKKYFLPN